ncbi:MAG TPA: TIGR03619 family F420-dependent LLM class oxidoreductase [Acetobacteraceae bacterium]|jgi:probable F420-dependent oxidoreductase|nr:TIGR03619 family F420-dependent LLM class oxidoreductase [Acetobacteraceae bacterium]
MQYGAGFPLQALPDAAAIRAYATALEDAGFDFTGTAGHVLGQPAGTHPDRAAPQYVGPFNDPFVTFSYLAGVTQRIRFMSAILILPALPTGLVAKQAAELALVSGGRFELGVGISWNAAEYHALGQDPRTRAARLEEQVTVLRRLWSEPYVTFKGRFHDFENVGLVRPAAIPIWFGTGTDEPVLRRVARLADGWMTIGDFLPHVPRFQQYLRDSGREPAGFPIRASLVAGDGGPAAWIETGRKYQAAGVTHITIGAPPALTSTQALERLAAARAALAQALG